MWTLAPRQDQSSERTPCSVPPSKAAMSRRVDHDLPVLRLQGQAGNRAVQRLPWDGAKLDDRGHGMLPGVVKDVLRSSGQQLDGPMRDAMQRRFGHDFSRVRVHADENAAVSAAAVRAKAYAAGDHIVFGANSYQPSSTEGRRLLVHELTHVVQRVGAATSLDALRMGPADGTLETQARAEETIGLEAAPAGPGCPTGVIQRDVLPVARFSPAPGLFVDRTQNSTRISGAMELYGPEANAARAASIQNSINSTWTRTFPDGYAMICSITVAYRPGGSSSGIATQIEADRIAGPSHVSPRLDGRSMTLNANEADAFTWTPAHEFGHIIGLRDRYSEGILSKVKGVFGGERTTTVQTGYAGNLMAVSGGALESKNIRDLAEEDEPTPYWINDDDQVRNWANAHSLSEIRRLSTASKLRAIKTLMGGWISDGDVGVIAKICSSVLAGSEADAIRAGVDLLAMTDIGQRTLVRVALSRMP